MNRASDIKELEKALRRKLTDEERALITEQETPYGQQIASVRADDLKKVNASLEADPDEHVKRLKDKIEELLRMSEWRRLEYLWFSLAYDGRGTWRTVRRNGTQSVLGNLKVPDWMPAELMAETNHVQQRVEKAVARFMGDRSILEVQPRTGSLNDEDGARIANMLVRNFDDDPRLQDELESSAYDMAIMGPAIFKTEWDANLLSTIEVEGEKRYGVHGEVCSREVHPDRLLVREDIRRLDDAPFVVERMYMSRQEITRRWPAFAMADLRQDSGREIDVANWITDYVTNHVQTNRALKEGSAHYNSTWCPASDDTYLVYDCYERQYEKEWGVFWYRTVLCNGKILERGVYAPGVRNEKGEKVPITKPTGQVVLYPLPYQFSGYVRSAMNLFPRGLVSLIISDVQRKNHLESYMMKIVHDMSILAVALQEEDTITPAYQDGVIEMRYANEVPKRVQFAEWPTNFEMMLAHSDKAIDEASMLPDVMRGEYKAGTPAELYHAAAAEAHSGHIGVNGRWARFKGQVYSHALLLQSIHYTDNRIVAVTEEGQTAVESFNGSVIEDHTDVVLTMGALNGLPRYAQEQKIREWAEAGYITPEQAARALQTGRTVDPFDMNQKQRSEERRIIQQIIDMGDDECAKLLASIIQARNAVGQLAGQVPVDQYEPLIGSAEIMQKMADARNSAMLRKDIGIDVGHIPFLPEHMDVLLREKVGSRYKRLKRDTPNIAAIIDQRLELIQDKMSEPERRMAMMSQPVASSKQDNALVG